MDDQDESKMTPRSLHHLLECVIAFGRKVPLEECEGRSIDRSIDVHRAQLLIKQELLHQAAPDGIHATVVYCNIIID